MPERHINLLSIEDDPDTVEFLRTAVAPRVHEFHTARSLNEGLQRLTKGDIGCVLADLKLPDAYGVETVTRIQERFPHVPIVVLTGASMDWDAATLAGAQAVIIKPVTADVIATAVHHAVVRHMVRKSYEPANQALQEAINIVEDQLKGDV